MERFHIYFEDKERDNDIMAIKQLIKNPGEDRIKMYGGGSGYVDMLKRKLKELTDQSVYDLQKKYFERKGIGDKEGAKSALFKIYEYDPEAYKEFYHKEKIRDIKEEDAADRCKRKADQVYGKKTSAYKSGAIVRCRKGKIWKKK